jgi:hypothetical protein
MSGEKIVLCATDIVLRILDSRAEIGKQLKAAEQAAKESQEKVGDPLFMHTA